LRVHLLGGKGHGGDGGVEVDAAVLGDLVAGDHVAGPRLDRAEGAALDAGDLDEAGNGVAGEAKVVLKGGIGGVGDDDVGLVVGLGDEGGGHGGRDTDLGLAAALG